MTASARTGSIMFPTGLRYLFLLGALLCPASANLFADPPSVEPPNTDPPSVLDGKPSKDQRLRPLKNLNGYFPFRSVSDHNEWLTRQRQIKRRILVSQGLWPMPTRTPLNAVIHGRVERDDYVVDRVYFESVPGHFVTGSLYRPRKINGKCPAILSPHGHWNNGRFYDAGESTARSEIAKGAEQSIVRGRFPIQARAVQLARMGCLVFVYDMIGYADSIQIGHRPASWKELDRRSDWGFMSVQADLRLQNMMGLQTWNSIRAVDFLLSIDEVDSARIGITGASGGGTQSMILAAIDQRVAAAMPCVMVSTAMQGGCTCENAPLLRIGQGNIDIAAAAAPRPLGLTAADDWTIELRTKGYPDLKRVYELVGHPERLSAVFHTQFKHNYNAVNRAAMYEFFNQHFELGWDQPIEERDFVPLRRDEATVWTSSHPAPEGDAVGAAHEIQLLKLATDDQRQQTDRLIALMADPNTVDRNAVNRKAVGQKEADSIAKFREVIGEGWQTILGRSLSDVGKVEFQPATTSRLEDGTVIRGGVVRHAAVGEELPVVRIEPPTPRKGVIIWLSDVGKRGLFDDHGLNPNVRQLLDRGWLVMSADLLQQGEFLDAEAEGPNVSQRMGYQGNGAAGWQQFSGYTFGYNHSLFSSRVHDVLTLIKHAESMASDVRLVGTGNHAGLWAAAAASQSGDATSEIVVEIGDFRFENISKHNDAMFVPGAVKYLDVDGLVSLVAPRKLTVVRENALPVTKRLYHAYSANQAYTSADRLTSVLQQW